MAKDTAKPKSKGRVAVIVIVAVLVVLFIASFVVDKVILDRTYQRQLPRGNVLSLAFDDYADEYTRTAVEFTLDGKTLRGYVYGPENNDRGLVVFRHGIFSEHRDYLAMIMALVDKGWKVFAYDAIGCGESGGDNVVGMAQSAIDVHAALQFVKESGMAGNLPVALWGHSWGGYGVAAALNYGDDVFACVTMSGFNDPCDILYETSERMLGGLGVTQRPTLWLNNKLAFGNNANLTGVDGINKSGIPVMIVHGTADTVVRYDTTGIIAQRDRITNDKVTYWIADEEGRDGHNTYFYAPDSYAYLTQVYAKWGELSERFDGDVPESEARALRDEVDVLRANTADPMLINAIDEFLASALAA